MHLLFPGTACVFYAQKQTGRVLPECLLAVCLLCGYPRVSVCVQHVPERCATPRVFKPQEADVWLAHVPLTPPALFLPYIIFPRRRRRRNSCPAVERAPELYPLKKIIKNLKRGPRQGHQKADMSWHIFKGPNHPHFSSRCVHEGLMCNTVAQRCTCTGAQHIIETNGRPLQLHLPSYYLFLPSSVIVIDLHLKISNYRASPFQ